MTVKEYLRYFPEMKEFDPVAAYPRTETSNVLNRNRQQIEVEKCAKTLAYMASTHKKNKDITRILKYLIVVSADLDLGLDWMKARKELKVNELFIECLYRERSFA